MPTIRPARTDEIPALRELSNRAAWALAGPLPERLAGLVTAGTAFVAQVGDALVGYGALNVGTKEVEAVFVDPAATGRGLGRLFLKKLEEVAGTKALNQLCLSSSLNAVTFYSAAGYKEVRRPDYELASGVALASVLMQKQLRPAV